LIAFLIKRRISNARAAAYEQNALE
jgi:hypothetical protein